MSPHNYSLNQSMDGLGMGEYCCCCFCSDIIKCCVMKHSQDVITRLGAHLLMFSGQFLTKLFDFCIKPGALL